MWAGELPVDFHGERVVLKVREIKGNIMAEMGRKQEELDQHNEAIKAWQKNAQEGEVNKRDALDAIEHLEKAIRETLSEMCLLLAPDVDPFVGLLSTTDLGQLFQRLSDIAQDSGKKKQEALLSGSKKPSSNSAKRATPKKKSAAGTASKRKPARSRSVKPKSRRKSKT